MSKSVIIAIIVVSIFFMERVILGITAIAAGRGSLLAIIISAGISALILVGIIKGNKLAWQWGRILGFLSAVLLSILAVGAIVNSDISVRTAGVIFGSQAILLYILFFALGTESSRKYFQLVCPKCGSKKIKAGNFFFTKTKCKSCNDKW